MLTTGNFRHRHTTDPYQLIIPDIGQQSGDVLTQLFYRAPVLPTRGVSSLGETPLPKEVPAYNTDFDKVK